MLLSKQISPKAQKLEKKTSAIKEPQTPVFCHNFRKFAVSDSEPCRIELAKEEIARLEEERLALSLKIGPLTIRCYISEVIIFNVGLGE